MSSGLYSITTRASGTVLTAAIYNADHQNHVTNQNPSMTGAYSDNVAQMQIQTSPGGVGTEALPVSLAGELERIRYVIAAMRGETYWYSNPISVNRKIKAKSTGTITAPLTTAENIILTVSFAAGEVALNTFISVWLAGDLSNTANGKTIKGYIGAAGAGIGGTSIYNAGMASCGNYWIDGKIANNNSLAVQKSNLLLVVVPSGVNAQPGAAAVNTANAWELVFSVTKVTAAESVTLNDYLIETITNGL